MSFNGMNKDDTQKLDDSLRKEQAEIEKELKNIATENPLVKGDFDVKVEDLGPSQEDAAQEAGELDRNQAIVDELERKLKNIIATREKIKKGSYGRCEGCSVDIVKARLDAIPTASLCIACANKQ
jgi:DnaK suppressor protein